VCSVAPIPVQPPPPEAFLDVLQGWGHTWIWNDMKVVGSMDWLTQAIAGGMLNVVTDGSYIRGSTIYPRPTGPTYALGPYTLEKEKEWYLLIVRR
jgi:hypothetical protein